MIYAHGDIVLGRFPHSNLQGTSRRPMLIVQNDLYNQVMQNMIIVQITSNLRWQSSQATLLIDRNHPDWHRSGLLTESLITCHNLATLHETVIDRKIGELSAPTMKEIDQCLKASLGL